MLLLFILHIIISFSCLCAGFLFYRLTGGSRPANANNRPLIFYLITGLVCLTLVAQIAVLFFPLNGYWQMAVFALLLLLLIRFKNDFSTFIRHLYHSFKNYPPIHLLLLLALWILILVTNAGPIIMDDTESYHIQMIKWVNEYGSVPGIVNLHNRFGFNSSWFISAGCFLPGSDSHNYYSALNGVVSLWFCSFLIGQLSYFSQRGKRTLSPLDIGILLVLLFSLGCWPMVRGNAATANYDFITTFIVLILFVKLLQPGKTKMSTGFAIEWVIWPVYLFTIRIINYPFLLLSLYGLYWLLKNKQWRFVAISIIISFCLAAAFIARNVILAGYPLYPSMAFDIFNVDWKADPNMIKGLLDYIKYFNRVNEMFIPIEETAKLNFPGWVTAWFRYMFLYDKPVLITGLAGFLIALMLLKRFIQVSATPLRFFVVILIIQLISWFWIAPDPRFVYGCLLCGILLIPVLLAHGKAFALPGSIYASVLAVLSVIIIAYAGFKATKNKDYSNFVYPYQLPKPPVKEIIIDNIHLRIPEKILNNWNPRCYATDLPCLYIVNPKLRARGNNVSDGFRLEK